MRDFQFSASVLLSVIKNDLDLGSDEVAEETLQRALKQVYDLGYDNAFEDMEDEHVEPEPLVKILNALALGRREDAHTLLSQFINNGA